MDKRRTAMAGLLLLLALGMGFFPKALFGGDESRAKQLIQQSCASCHRFQGQAESRFNLKAPDLIWAGSKYQRPWLIRWLTGKEAPLYAKGIMGAALTPAPRNFTCGKLTKDLPDGQLFWIIKNGSPGTGVMSFAGLPDDQVWQVIRYIRSLAR